VHLPGSHIIATLRSYRRCQALASELAPVLLRGDLPDSAPIVERHVRESLALTSAFQVFQEAIGEAPPPPEREKNAAAVALGKLGGAKGGAARTARMTPEERAECSERCEARWKNRKAGP
jgi:hypothetical protein